MNGQIFIWSFYDKTTGIFSGHQFTGHESILDINTPPDHNSIEGAYDAMSKRIDIATGEIIDYQPPQPSEDHFWNADTKRWAIKPEIVSKQNKRAAIMASIAALEATQHRPIREILLNDDNGEAKKKLQSIENEIIELRKGLV